MKTTFATEEYGLRLTVSPVGVATLVASLASMSGVNCHDLTAKSFSLVLKESLELGKAPRVKPSFSFPSAGFDVTPDVGEVFHDDSCTRLNAIKDRGRQDVVAIPSEALFTPSEASEMLLSRLRTIGLELTSEAEDTFNDFLHMPIAVKIVVGGNSRTSNTQVNPNSLSVIHKRNIGQVKYNMEVETTFTINKVSGSRRIARCILGIFRKIKRYLHPAVRGGQTDKSLIPVYFESMQVVPRRAHYRLWAAYLTSLLHLGNSRSHGFTGFLPGLDMQVRDESRQSILAPVVGQVMKGVSITCSLLPACVADSIERLGKLLSSFTQSLRLLWARLKLYTNCPIHIGIIPYILKKMQYLREEVSIDSFAT